VLEVRGGVDLYAFFDSALMYCEVEEFEGNSDGYVCVMDKIPAQGYGSGYDRDAIQNCM